MSLLICAMIYSWTQYFIVSIHLYINCVFFSVVCSTLILYDGDIGSSPSFELTTSASSLDDIGWNNRASLAVVTGGCQWILYGAAGFSGSTSAIGPGSYPEFGTSTFGIPENSLSAVRCLPARDSPCMQHLSFLSMVIMLVKCKLFAPLVQILDSLALTM